MSMDSVFVMLDTPEIHLDYVFLFLVDRTKYGEIMDNVNALQGTLEIALESVFK